MTVSVTVGPMSTTPGLEELEARRDNLRRRLASVGDLRPGSLVAQHRTCGNPVPLRKRWIARARSELVSDPRRCRQDGDARRSAGRGGEVQGRPGQQPSPDALSAFLAFGPCVSSRVVGPERGGGTARPGASRRPGGIVLPAVRRAREAPDCHVRPAENALSRASHLFHPACIFCLTASFEADRFGLGRPRDLPLLPPWPRSGEASPAAA